MISEVNEKIKQLCFEKRMSINQLAEEIGMSNSLHTTLKNNSLKVETLIKISNVLNVSTGYFFSSDQKNNGGIDISVEIEELKKELETTHETYKIEADRLEVKRRLINWIYFFTKFNILGNAKTVAEENHSERAEKLYSDIQNLLTTINKSERLDYEDDSFSTNEKSFSVVGSAESLKQMMQAEKKKMLTKKAQKH